MPQVFDLTTEEYGEVYTCSPREAVIAAYAQSKGDYNTWDYEKKYGEIVVETERTLLCGNFVVGKFANQ